MFFWGLEDLLGTRTLLGAPGLTTRNKKLLGTSASLPVTSALLLGTTWAPHVHLHSPPPVFQPALQCETLVFGFSGD